MKKCIDCKIPKKINEYSEDKKRNRHLSVCKKCMALRTKIYRQKNQDKWKKQSKNHSLRRKEMIDNWKLQGCSKCKDKRHYIIDAHHKDPNKKDFSIGESANGINKTKKELEKCIPLCSNCHREFHYLERLNNINIEDYLKIF